MKKFLKTLAIVLVACVTTLSAVLLVGCGGSDMASISISDDGYWVINGKKSETKARCEEDCVVTYDFNLGGKTSSNEIDAQLLQVFDDDGYEKVEAKISGDDIVLKYKKVLKKGDSFELYDFNEIGLADYFLGWFYNDDIKVSDIFAVSKDVTLKAKWTTPITQEITTAGRFYYKELSSTELTAMATPLKDAEYDKWYNPMMLKNLVMMNNKFYKIVSFSSYYNGIYTINKEVQEEKINIICVPDTALECFEWNVKNGDLGTYNHYYLTNHYDKDNDLYYIGDYVIKQTCDKSKQNAKIQFIYKVDYQKKEAKLINSYNGPYMKFGLASGGIDYVALKDGIKDFNICKDGVNYEIKVTEISDAWFKPYVSMDLTMLETFENKANIDIMIGENVKYIGSCNYATGYDISSEDIKNIEKLGGEFTISFYSLSENIGDIGYNKSGPCVYKIYAYSATEPTENLGLYWHYDTDGVTPVLWA